MDQKIDDGIPLSGNLGNTNAGSFYNSIVVMARNLGDGGPGYCTEIGTTIYQHSSNNPYLCAPLFVNRY